MTSPSVQKCAEPEEQHLVEDVATAPTEQPNDGIEDKENEKEEQEKDKEDEDDKQDDEKEDAEEPEEEQREEDEEVVAAVELEGCRPMSESLFETVGSSVAAEHKGMEGLQPSEAEEIVVGLVAAPDLLRRSRVRWLVVRLSHRVRTFLAQPSLHFLRLVSILRYFTALIEALPPSLLLHMLEPLLTPVYRCVSAFGQGSASTLPDVQTLEQVVQLEPAQQLEFLAQLGQACMDSLTNKMQDDGRSSELMQALGKVRKAVERRRTDRLQKKRLQVIVDPQAAALRKRSKNRRKLESRKRKTDEIIMKKKGGRGDAKARKIA